MSITNPRLSAFLSALHDLGPPNWIPMLGLHPSVFGVVGVPEELAPAPPKLIPALGLHAPDAERPNPGDVGAEGMLPELLLRDGG